MPREVRVAQADFVIDNSDTTDALAAQVERACAWIATLPESTETFSMGEPG